MTAHATHPQVPSTATTFRLPARRLARTRAKRAFGWSKAWMTTAALAVVSMAGVAALLAGIDSSAVAIVAVAASVAAGALAYLAPRPPASEVLAPTDKEAF